jgi:hypothetical protein
VTAALRLIKELNDKAACVTAGPRLMTSTSYDDHLYARDIFCAWCPVKELCLEVVRPRQSHFDGTSGARYWLDGVDMTARLTSPRFQSVTRYHHGHKTGSWRVRDALKGQYKIRDLNHSEMMLFACIATESGVSHYAVAEVLGVSHALVRVMVPVVKRDAPGRLLENSRHWRISFSVA